MYFFILQDNIEVMDQVTNMTKKYATPEEQMVRVYTVHVSAMLIENAIYKTHKLYFTDSLKS